MNITISLGPAVNLEAVAEPHGTANIDHWTGICVLQGEAEPSLFGFWPDLGSAVRGVVAHSLGDFVCEGNHGVSAVVKAVTA